jgi:hypothetical protein
MPFELVVDALKLEFGQNLAAGHPPIYVCKVLLRGGDGCGKTLSKLQLKERPSGGAFSGTY